MRKTKWKRTRKMWRTHQKKAGHGPHTTNSSAVSNIVLIRKEYLPINTYKLFFNSRGMNMSTIMNKSKHVHGKPRYCLTCGVAGWLSERQASPATSCPFVCLPLRSASAVEASTAFVLSSQHLPCGIRSGSRCLVHFSVYSASALQALPVSVLYISSSTQHR